MALGRQLMSLRLLAVAAIFCDAALARTGGVAQLPDELGSVLAIIALHDCAPAWAFLARRATSLA
jgi:hypothetical protein